MSIGVIHSQQKPKILVILGPTASGKSDLAVELAKKSNGEIVSADSRQVYKGMNIGTGKVPISYERSESTKSSIPAKVGIQMFYKGIPHHLLDVASPRTKFDVARYQKMAHKKIAEILKRGKLPIVCGGTGLYIKAIVENQQYPDIPPDWKLRRKLGAKTTDQLFSMLKKLDPKRSETIDRKNPRRLIRAIEIAKQAGKVPPEKPRPLYDVLLIGIKKSPEELRKAIAVRLRKRMRQGMIAEVKKLHSQRVGWKRLEEFGLEYRYIALYLQGKMDKQTMLGTLETKINQYAKRQMTWFRKTPDVRWISTKREGGQFDQKLHTSKQA